MKALVLFAAVPVLAALAPAPAGVLDTHVAAMQKAKLFTVTFNLTEVGGNQEVQTLTLSKPGFLRYETGSTLTLVDGKTVTVYQKGKKTYTQSNIADGWPKSTFANDMIWVWSAFFDDKFAKQVTSSKAGNGMNVRGVQLAELTLNRDGKVPVTVFFDKKTGLARGATFKNDRGVDVIIQATAIEASEKEAETNTFAWVAPEGATLAAAEDPNRKLVFADIRPILARSCGNCHMREAKGNVNLNSAATTMSSGVVAETSADSKLVRVMRSGQMPPPQRGSAVPKADIDKIAKWIDDGANE